VAIPNANNLYYLRRLQMKNLDRIMKIYTINYKAKQTSKENKKYFRKFRRNKEKRIVKKEIKRETD